MKITRLFALTALLGAAAVSMEAQVTPASQMEKLDRGVVAVAASGTENFVSWRLLGTDDKSATTFDLLRDGQTIASDLKVTNYSDQGATASAKYQVVTKVNGKAVDTSAETATWGKKYLTLKLDRPAAGTNKVGTNFTYTPNDMSVGDVDGDGQYELILKWDPSNSQDNGHATEGEYTGHVLLDCYRLDGTKLWRIDLGPNIRAGAHYTQFQVYDYDGDGRAELMCKTAPGSIDGQGKYVNQAATDATIKGHDNSKEYANINGIVISGPEYLTVFNGLTGEAIHTVWYNPNRAGTLNQEGAHPNNKTYWGDNYGNRSDRYLAATAYLDGPDERPAAIFVRGYYTRAFVWAVTFDGQQLHTKWLSDSQDKNYLNLYLGDEMAKQPRKSYTRATGRSSGSKTMYGNGNHNLSIADVDGDGRDEIVWGSAALDDTGYMLYATGYGHGDAIHLGQMIPGRAGYQVFQVHEEKLDATLGCWDLHDAATGEVLHHGGSADKDNGRGLAADLTGKDGYEFWSSDERNPRSAATGSVVINKSCAVNFRIYWDGDLADELLDGGYNGETVKITKYQNNSFPTIREFGSSDNNPQTCNSTKRTPSLQADIVGDWREELVMWNYKDPSEIMIYTTTTPTDYAVPTLMHDHVYRMGICWQNTAYNQPPHLGYYLPDYINGTITGIRELRSQKGIDADSDATTYYDLQGRRLDGLQKGVNIAVEADGTVKKILVK